VVKKLKKTLKNIILEPVFLIRVLKSCSGFFLLQFGDFVLEFQTKISKIAGIDGILKKAIS